MFVLAATSKEKGFYEPTWEFEERRLPKIAENACFCCGETTVDPIKSLMKCVKEEIRSRIEGRDFKIEEFDAG